MASAGGGIGATEEIPEVEMEVVERPPEELGRVGSKRARDPPSALGSYGFYGASTTEKKPMLQPHVVNAPRLNSSSPGENPENKTNSATNICTFYTQGWCQKGKNCTFLHERGGLLAPAGSGNHRGSEEVSQVQYQLNLKVPQFKGAEGSSEHERWRSLIHVYGENNERLSHLADKQHLTTPGVSQGLLGKDHIHFMGQLGLAAETYLDGRGAFPSNLDGGNFRSGVDKRNSLSDSHVSRRYDVNCLNSDHQFQSFGMPISSYPLQLREKLPAYGRTMENLPNTHQKEHCSSHASYGSRSLAGFGNPSEISLGSPTLRATSHLGMQSHHLFTTGIEKVNLHGYIDVGKGCGTSRPALLSSSSPDRSIMSAGPLSPIKDEVWETSVPFVPSFNFPDSTTPPGSPYDPFVDCIEPPKVENKDNLKSSNISFSISSQHTNQDVITDKSMNRDGKLTRNMSAKGANGPACLIASDRGHSSSLEDNNRAKACDRKNDAGSNNEKAREFRFHLAEHIKDLIKPIWKEGILSKDAHKHVVKKSVEKVAGSILPNQVPTTKELIAKYITSNESKIEKLVKAYVDRHRTT
ncbi:unnamed protein product [Urochloa decumbens]|uniref:C3H1-type domain-containing protein n=2 Tax=Urochloa decumbens TaxID=240449 RepID=A0ABC8WII6_9POAL